jgi:DNA repair protein RecN (Recombination protein N)
LLKKLTIQNYALIDRVEIEFHPGLTVLTGETGAGKSVIIGGLLLALGARADKEFIRHGQDRASAEAVFGLSPVSSSRRKSGTQEAADDGDVRLSRELLQSGTSRAYIDDHLENMAAIREKAAALADFHSQQGQRHLLDVEHHLEILDSFAGLTADAEGLKGTFARLAALEKQLKEAQADAEAMRQKLELVNFQIEELTKAEIKAGEEERLTEERRRLESVQTLAETGQAVIAAVSEADDSILTVLAQLDRRLAEAAKIDARLAGDAAMLSESVINLNELTRNLESYLSRLEDNPERLDEINARQAELYRLRKKYQTDEAGLLAKLEELRNFSGGAGDYETLIGNLTRQTAESRKAYHEAAVSMSRKRRQAAAQLEKKVERELADLAMEKTRFRIDFAVEHDPEGFELDGEMVKAWPHGLENAEFLIAANPNEPLRPLVKVASGGEMSRIMLALLTVSAGKYKLPTIIFDEIDTGIGGRTAFKLAEKLKELSSRHQVITISHLPAIASVADHHLAVEKRLKGGRNLIMVREVTGAESKKELARMAGKE